MKRKAQNSAGALVARPGLAQGSQSRWSDSGARSSTYEDLSTRVRQTERQGRCLIATQQAKANSVLMEYAGDPISRNDLPQRIKQHTAQGVAEQFYLHISPSCIIDATKTETRARLMTYSRTPNCQMQNWNVDDRQRAFVVALEDIMPGTELTYTFYQQCSLGPHVRCLCGAARCAQDEAAQTLSPATVKRRRQETEHMAEEVIRCIQAGPQRSPSQAPPQVAVLNPHSQTALHPLSSAALNSELQTAVEQAMLDPNPPSGLLSQSHDTAQGHAQQMPACPESPHLLNCPLQAAREDINILGLDSPDSYLDRLHIGSVNYHGGQMMTLESIASKCQKLTQQLASPQPVSGANQADVSHAHVSNQAPAAVQGGAGHIAASPLAPASTAQQLAKQLHNKAPVHRHHASHSEMSRFAPSLAQPAMLGPARQAGQLLQEHLAQYRGEFVGGYALDPETNEVRQADMPYQRMLSLKATLSQRLQANQSTDALSLLVHAGWRTHLQHAAHSTGPHSAAKGTASSRARQGAAGRSQAQQSRDVHICEEGHNALMQSHRAALRTHQGRGAALPKRQHVSADVLHTDYSQQGAPVVQSSAALSQAQQHHSLPGAQMHVIQTHVPHASAQPFDASGLLVPNPASSFSHSPKIHSYFLPC